MFSALGLTLVVLVVGIVITLIKRGQQKWQLVLRRRQIFSCTSRSPVIVLIHSVRDPLKTAALVNLMLRQASRPTRIIFQILEELKNSGQGDTRQHYSRHYNTLDDHRSRIHVYPLPRRGKQELTHTQALAKLIRMCNDEGLTPSHQNSTLVWIDASTTYIIPEWDTLLVDSIDKNPRSIATSVPLHPKHSPITAEEVLGSRSFVSNEDLVNRFTNQRIKYPYLDRHGRMMSAYVSRNLSRSMIPPRSPFLHPCLVCGRGNTFFTRLNKNKITECSSADFGPTMLLPGLFSLLPFNLYSVSFRPTKPKKETCTKMFPVSTDFRLGMWVGGSKAERLLGIILRYGSEQEFRHLRHKVSAFQSTQ